MNDVLIMLIVLSSIFRLSRVDRRWQLAYSLVLALALWWSMRYAVQLSKPALAAWLQTTEVRQLMAIGITLETMLTLLLSLTPAGPRRRPLHALALTVLNVTLPPTLFYMLAQTVFRAVGADLSLLGILFAAAVAVGLPLLCECASRLLPEPGSRRDAHLLMAVLLCMVGLFISQHNPLIYEPIHTEQSILTITMEIISKALFGIANALLIPDIILLVFFFFRSLVLLGGTYRQFMARRQGGHSQLYDKYLAMLRSKAPSEPWTDYVVTQFEAEAQKDINLSRLLTKLGPVLGLIGTLISMSPALVGLSTGDIAGMAYNMQVVFSATVVGLFISAIGLFTQQLKARWYAKDASQLDYDSSLRIED